MRMRSSSDVMTCSKILQSSRPIKPGFSHTILRPVNRARLGIDMKSSIIRSVYKSSNAVDISYDIYHVSYDMI